MLRNPSMFVAQHYQPIFRQIGLDADGVFTHPAIQAWRSIAERENCTLDANLPDIGAVRWHIKRYRPVNSCVTPAEEEAQGHRLLLDGEIPTASLVAWGVLEDGRSFIILDDLAGYQPADKMVAAGFPFARLLSATADLAARLHNAGLHHRDLYLCHFFAKDEGGRADLRLIDAARVRALPRWFAHRWIVKDLAQFWYSTLQLTVTGEQRQAWLEHYAAARNLAGAGRLRRQIERKASSISRHDRRLRKQQPGRNISIP